MICVKALPKADNFSPSPRPEKQMEPSEDIESTRSEYFIAAYMS